MKKLILMALIFAFFTVTQVHAKSWMKCGKISQLYATGELSAYPTIKYEYGIVYNSSEPFPIISTTWNYGIRIYNRQPYMVRSDNPEVGMGFGGLMFYKGTQASDDNCGDGTFRHRYWWLDSSNTITTGESNGCFGTYGKENIDVYCRAR